MRIDKYLKQTGLIKRRVVAQQMIESGKVQVNGRNVRSSYEVKIGDVIRIIFPFREVEAMVTEENSFKILRESKREPL
ncbi:S4 domain-containing protein [Pseudothermotoga sp.]|nr:S4 domain-containing protein [Pseudothermotoga sp.]MDW8139356.1 S4 domain-containing protein [Pseudothermotoga sp.]